jgi:hypothetical protein
MRQQERHRSTDTVFHSTRWSQVVRAADADPAVRRAALTSLLTTYLPALSSYMRWHRRIPADRLDDLLQGFVCDQVVAGELFSSADPNRGQFRMFILKSLERYVRRVHRFETARKRTPHNGLVSLNDDDGHGVAAATVDDDVESAGVSFDLAWAREVIRQAMLRMRDDCGRRGRDVLWTLFEERVVKPIFEDVPALNYETLVARLGLTSAAQAGNLLITSKRMFGRHIRDVIGEYASDDADVEEELRHLWTVFSRHRPATRS